MIPFLLGSRRRPPIVFDRLVWLSYGSRLKPDLRVEIDRNENRNPDAGLIRGKRRDYDARKQLQLQ
ncbi:MAG: hypothetical protein CL912_15425 [Deltaproteobacteria bacterium]|nr:hypothetical protein [Deltaproteobacteria bacterium]